MPGTIKILTLWQNSFYGEETFSSSKIERLYNTIIHYMMYVKWLTSRQQQQKIQKIIDPM